MVLGSLAVLRFGRFDFGPCGGKGPTLIPDGLKVVEPFSWAWYSLPSEAAAMFAERFAKVAHG
jgi:hypothetical protein